MPDLKNHFIEPGLKKKNLEIFDFGQEVSIPVWEHPSIRDLRNYHYPILIYCCNQVNDKSSMITKMEDVHGK